MRRSVVHRSETYLQSWQRVVDNACVVTMPLYLMLRQLFCSSLALAPHSARGSIFLDITVEGFFNGILPWRLLCMFPHEGVRRPSSKQCRCLLLCPASGFVRRIMQSGLLDTTKLQECLIRSLSRGPPARPACSRREY